MLVFGESPCGSGCHCNTGIEDSFVINEWAYSSDFEVSAIARG